MRNSFGTRSHTMIPSYSVLKLPKLKEKDSLVEHLNSNKTKNFKDYLIYLESQSLDLEKINENLVEEVKKLMNDALEKLSRLETCEEEFMLRCSIISYNTTESS